MNPIEKLTKIESGVEREKFEKIIILIRHPSTQLDQLMTKGDDETPWDDLENKVFIERGRGHEMSKEFSEHLVREIPQMVDTTKGRRVYKVLASPLPRARALAKYALLHLQIAHQRDSKIPLPLNQEVEIVSNFAEIPMAYSKGKILEIIADVKKQNKPTMAAMEEWFKSDPVFIASVFEKERQRVLDGLEKIRIGETPINLIYTHRLVTGFILWLIQNRQMDKKVSPDDLPGIMEIARNIPYVSESEIGWNKNGWTVIRRGDVSHLDKKLVAGTF
ncbi:MAG: hypothetical protein NTV81_03625 [Candidatus Komeilibacteria bacterium]|nr:hypothetical protein [Candidatus Komeilibacteria bacterium]